MELGDFWSLDLHIFKFGVTPAFVLQEVSVDPLLLQCFK